MGDVVLMVVLCSSVFPFFLSLRVVIDLSLVLSEASILPSCRFSGYSPSWCETARWLLLLIGCQSVSGLGYTGVLWCLTITMALRASRSRSIILFVGEGTSPAIGGLDFHG